MSAHKSRVYHIDTKPARPQYTRTWFALHQPNGVTSLVPEYCVDRPGGRTMLRRVMTVSRASLFKRHGGIGEIDRHLRTALGL